MVEILGSFWDGLFSGAMLVSGSVCVGKYFFSSQIHPGKLGMDICFLEKPRFYLLSQPQADF